MNPFIKVYSKEEAKELKKAIKEAYKKLEKEIITKPRDEWGREPGDPMYGMPPEDEMPMKPMDSDEDKKDYDFEVIATTEGIDRDGEMIKKDGWDFTNYLKNPVLLWGHDHMSLPIGKVTDIIVTDTDIRARGIFAQTQFAKDVKALYDQGILKAVSVGFLPQEREGNIITKSELLELSFVNVPSNPEATATGKALRAFEAKWFPMSGLVVKAGEVLKVEIKEEKSEELKEEVKQLEPVSDLLAEYPRAKKDESAKINVKEGRVLSSKNRTLVEDAVTTLNSASKVLRALLDASETPEKDIQEDLIEIKQKAQTVDKTNEELIRLIKQKLTRR